ncbi:MAG: hypothetical protein GW917_03415 [Bdellovibrionales bacterium]|nr:hypothetical protein [Bdellovibrionales bacterium]
MSYFLTYAMVMKHVIVVANLKTGEIHEKNFTGQKKVKREEFVLESGGPAETKFSFLNRINDKIAGLRLLECE